MAKLSEKPKSKVAKTINKAGGIAYSLPDEESFISSVLTCLCGEPKFYGDTTPKIVGEAIGLIQNGKSDLVLQTAIYARKAMNLRSTPVMLLGIYALHKDGDRSKLRAAINQVCTRPDQLQELVGYINKFDESIPRKQKALQKGIADVLLTLDEYQFGKYNNKPHSVKIRDLMRLSHPVPADDSQAQLFKSVVEGNVATPDTWEVLYSNAKSDTEKAEVWSYLFKNNKLPYMAALRNLRNMAQCGLNPDILTQIGSFIADPERVKRSRQFPYRFYAAYNMLQKESDPKVRIFLASVAKALEHSVHNLPTLVGTTFSTADNSGSMSARLSDRSEMRYVDIANLFQAVMAKAYISTITSVFGMRFAIVNTSPTSSIMDMANTFKNTEVGHSTHAYLAVEHLINTKTKVDRIVLFSDMQVYGDRNVYMSGPKDFKEMFDQYRREINPNCWLHCVDLAGHGTTPAPMFDKNVNLISGWSDSVVSYISKVEMGLDGMAKDIKSVIV